VIAGYCDLISQCVGRKSEGGRRAPLGGNQVKPVEPLADRLGVLEEINGIPVRFWHP
jgi:hypothetical protein